MFPKYLSSAIIFLLLTVAVFGCSSQKNDSTSGSAQKNSQQQHSSARGAGKPLAAAVVATPRDQAEAATVKDRVVSQLQKTEFTAIYKEASAGFREVGPEEQFVAQWNKQLLETGQLKNIKETAHTVRPSDGFIVYLFTAQYENMTKEVRLTFGRSKKDKMELTGINQHAIKK